ncbi:MAG: TM2 domain-containing protein [Bacteroidales bacterium]|nr:TM2 domain-containing protein [Bacteroidales bacterium]
MAGVLAILLGGLGVQYFYLGKIGGGFITILLSLCTCGCWSILTLVQGILMLTMPNQEFERKYVYSNSVFPLF